MTTTFFIRYFAANNIKNIIVNYMLPVALGTAACIVVLGWQPILPENIAWLQKDLDSAQHYIGWFFYRNSPWSFPIGANPYFGMELGSSIVYSDSIPLLAVFFKLFSGLLPETFQYFGLWLLLCFILQAFLPGNLPA